jgi:hypothetical protein
MRARISRDASASSLTHEAPTTSQRPWTSDRGLRCGLRFDSARSPRESRAPHTARTGRACRHLETVCLGITEDGARSGSRRTGVGQVVTDAVAADPARPRHQDRPGRSGRDRFEVWPSPSRCSPTTPPDQNTDEPISTVCPPNPLRSFLQLQSPVPPGIWHHPRPVLTATVCDNPTMPCN